MLTVGSKSPSGPLLAATFSAAIFASAVPHEPDPTIATRCLPDGSGDRGSGFGMGEGGRVAAGVVAVEDAIRALLLNLSSRPVKPAKEVEGVGWAMWSAIS